MVAVPSAEGAAVADENETIRRMREELVRAAVSGHYSSRNSGGLVDALIETAYIAGNTLGAVGTFVLISTVADKAFSSPHLRAATRLAVGGVSIAAGVIVRNKLRSSSVGRLIGNSLIGGGTLSTVSGAYMLLTANKPRTATDMQPQAKAQAKAGQTAK